MSLFIGSKWRKTRYKKWAFKSDGEETFFTTRISSLRSPMSVQLEFKDTQRITAGCKTMTNETCWLALRCGVTAQQSPLFMYIDMNYFFLYFFSALLLSCPHMFLPGKTGLTRSLKGFYNHFFSWTRLENKDADHGERGEQRAWQPSTKTVFFFFVCFNLNAPFVKGAVAVRGPEVWEEKRHLHQLAARGKKMIGRQSVWSWIEILKSSLVNLLMFCSEIEFSKIKKEKSSTHFKRRKKTWILRY